MALLSRTRRLRPAALAAVLALAPSGCFDRLDPAAFDVPPIEAGEAEVHDADAGDTVADDGDGTDAADDGDADPTD